MLFCDRFARFAIMVFVCHHLLRTSIAGEALDSTVVTDEVRDDEQGSLSEPEEEKNDAPLLSEKASEPVSAAFDDASLESPDSDTSPPPSVPAIEDEVSKFVEEVVEDSGMFLKLLLLE